MPGRGDLFVSKIYDELERLRVGGETWIAAEDPERVTRAVSVAKRDGRHALSTREFSYRLWTAVQHRTPGLVRVLVQVTRTA